MFLFFVIINNIKLDVTHQSHQAQEGSFQETAATLFQTDSTFQQVSYYSNGQIRRPYVCSSMHHSRIIEKSGRVPHFCYTMKI